VVFDVEGTWYGEDRDEATRLQGARSGLEHLAESETAYVTWLYCLMAQPEPRPRECELAQMGDPRYQPKAFQDHDADLWIPAHRHARMLLDELVTHALAEMRAREEWLRTHVEAPARAAAQETARVLSGKELALLRSEQIHDQLFHRAYRALCRSRRRSARAPRHAAVDRPAPDVARTRLLTGQPPRTHEQSNTVFFDYHAARRAVLDEDDSQCLLEDEPALPDDSPVSLSIQ
jgi:hypothetical protein